MLSLPNRIRCLHMKSVSRQFLATCATTVVDKALFLRIVNVLHCLKVHSISTVLTYECSHKLDIDTEEMFEIMWKLTADFRAFICIHCFFVPAHTLIQAVVCTSGTKSNKDVSKKELSDSAKLLQSVHTSWLYKGCGVCGIIGNQCT